MKITSITQIRGGVSLKWELGNDIDVKTIKSVQRQYYLLSCRFLLFTGEEKEDEKRSIFWFQYWGDRLSNQNVAWYAYEASLGKGRSVE